MPQSADLSPQDSDVENEIVGFDFGRALAVDEIVVSVTSVTCVAVDGTDASASSRLTGATTIVPSAATKRAAGQVNKYFGGSLDGVKYRLQCVVLTSHDQSLSIWAHISGKAPA